MTYFGIAVMAVFTAGDILQTYILKNDGFLSFDGRMTAVFLRLFAIVLLPYYAAYFLPVPFGFWTSLGLSAVVCAIITAVDMFVLKKSTKALAGLTDALCFAASAVSLYFTFTLPETSSYITVLCRGGVVAVLLILSAACYSAAKSKVSGFRYGKALTFMAIITSSAIFGLVTGWIADKCL